MMEKTIRFRDVSSIELEDVFPNPTKLELLTWDKIVEQQDSDNSFFEDWSRNHYKECVKILKQEIEELLETIKN